MNLRRWKFLCTVIALFVAVATYSVANAQDEVQITTHKLYVPQLSISRAQPGQYQPLTECSIGFELSQPFANGTTFEQIGDMLGIRTDDIWNAEHNRARFPERVIDSVTGSSPICWLGEYAYQTLYLEDADLVEPLNLYFPEGRGDYLTPVVMAGNNQVCQTLSVVFTVAEGTWNGAPIVGLLRRGSQVIGKLVCDVAIYVPEGVWRRSAYIFAIGTAAPQIYEATTQGDLTPPVLFDEEGTAALVYYALDIETMYPKCSLDAVLEADRLLIPRKRRLYLVGYENAGCLFSDVPFYEGQVALPLGRLDATMLLLTAYVQQQVLERPLTPEEVEQLMNRIQSELDSQLPDQEPDPEEEEVPYWFPERNPTSCPDVFVPLYVTNAINETLANVEYYLRYKTFPSPQLATLALFASDAMERAKYVKYEASYSVPKPRTDGALARLVSGPDEIGRVWAVQMVCHETIAGFVWLIQPVGRANSGLLRSDKDNVDQYQYK